MAKCRSPKPCYNKGCKCKSSYNEQPDPLTSKATYYIVEIDTLVDSESYDSTDSIKSYSIIKVTDSGAFEVDRAYRSVQEALDSWEFAIPPK